MSAFPNTSFSLKTSWISSRRGSPRFNLLASHEQSQVPCLPPFGIVNLLIGFKLFGNLIWDYFTWIAAWKKFHELGALQP